MPIDGTPGDRPRVLRPLLGLRLVLGLLAGALVLLGPGVLDGLRTGEGSWPGAAECTVETSQGEIGLDRQQGSEPPRP